MLYQGYSYTAQQVSELSAIGAPTRPVWIGMTSVWTALAIAFATGVWLAAGPKRSLRVTAVLLGAFAVVGLLWVLSAPMHRRGTAGLAGDISHLVFAGVQILVMVLFLVFGSGAGGTRFRTYSIATIVATLVFGALVGTQAAAIAAGQATPWWGLIERVGVYAPVLWVLVFAVVLLRQRSTLQSGPPPSAFRPIARHAV
jgi:hypothetical protein